MKNILLVHQSADLYGSDRVMLAFVSALDLEKYHPIVLLPVSGPLCDKLRAANIEYYIVPISRLSRSMLSLRGLLGLPINIYRSVRAINRILNGRKVDLVHSNTLAVLSGALWAYLHRVPHVWHVHEIILRPKVVRKVYACLLSWFADSIICISHATKENLLQDNPALSAKIFVVWNGLARESNVDAVDVAGYRSSLGLRDGEVLAVLIGRINRWKGQALLVDAASQLWQQGIRNVKFVIVGSAPEGQSHFLEELQKKINLSPAKDNILLQTFTLNVWSIWDACDFALIPSTEPEPFGMVALEAMVAGKPVVAANHGGLSEIVVHEKTGFLFAPNDVQNLVASIKLLSGNESLRQQMGRNGSARCSAEFSLKRNVENMVDVYERTMSDY